MNTKQIDCKKPSNTKQMNKVQNKMQNRGMFENINR